MSVDASAKDAEATAVPTPNYDELRLPMRPRNTLRHQLRPATPADASARDAEAPVSPDYARQCIPEACMPWACRGISYSYAQLRPPVHSLGMPS